MLDAFPESVCIVDPSLQVLEVNQVFCSLVGSPAEDLLGRPFPEVDGDAGAEILRRMVAAGPVATDRFECRVLHREGRLLDLEVSLRQVHWRDRRASIVICRDVSARKRAQRKLLESQARLAEAQRIARLGNWTWDIATDSIWWSDEIYRIFGFSVGEFEATYKGFLGAVHPDDRDSVRRAVQEALDHRCSYDIEHRVLRPDGEVLFVHEQGEVLFEDGRPVRMSGTVQDITQRKQAREQLARQSQLLEQVRDSVISTGLDGNVTTWNKGAERIFGYTAEEALGRHVSFIYPPEEQENLLTEVIEPLRRSGAHEVEVRVRRRSGEDFYCLLSLSMLYDSAGDPNGMVGVAIDITERKAALEAMRKFSSAIEQTADMILISDRSGVVEYVNPTFERVTGFNREEVVGKAAGFNRSDKHDQAFYAHMWQTILAGEVYRGIVINRRKDGNIYYEEKTIAPIFDDSGEITHFVSSGQDITKRIKDEEQLEFLAHYDAVTDLPNRILFHDRLERTLERHRRSGKLAAVLFLDLDHFKNINDSLGHAQGDEALRAVAERISRSVRNSDTVARISGDEFAVILEDLASAADAVPTAEKILEAVAAPVRLLGNDFSVTASLGISLFPRDGNDVHTLLKHADVAMYRAKGTGRNGFQFYARDMTTNVFERLTMESSLRRALDQSELKILYQPEVSVSSGAVTGLEVLLRWENPKLGLVLPEELIPLLEDTGLMIAVGEWVIGAAFRETTAWRGQGLPPVRLCINLSGLQLRNPGFAETVGRLARESGCNPASVEFEITETVLMERDEETMENLHDLGQLGVRFAIDDFGTGYSSLSYLRRFPIDTLKIDRSFIRCVDSSREDAALVRTIMAMARGLGIHVVAEGVETRQQLAFLETEGCETVQGFLFSRPLSGEQIPDFVASRQVRSR